MTRAAAHEKSVSVGRQAGHATEQKINIVVDASNFLYFRLELEKLESPADSAAARAAPHAEISAKSETEISISKKSE